MLSIIRINNQHYYSWGLLMTVLLIILFELDKFPNPLIGQNVERKNYIQLSRGDEILSISTGSWTAVIKKNIDQPIIGILCGKVNDNLCIENPNNGSNVFIPISDIKIFYHGEAKRIKHYIIKGAGKGFQLALLYGTFWGFMFASDGYGIDDAFGIGLMGAGCGSAVFIPPSALIGYLKGVSKEKKAVEYNFENGWKIL